MVSNSVVPDQTGAGKTPRSRILRLVIGWVAALLGGILGVSIVALVLLFHTPAIPAIHTDASAGRQLEKKLEEAQAASAAGSPTTVRANETELNSVFQRYVQAGSGNTPAKDNAVIRDIRFVLSQDLMRVYVTVDTSGKNLTVVLEGKLHGANGYLEFQPSSGKIGALPIPKSSLKKAFDQMAASTDARRLMRLPANLKEVYVEDGKLVLVYR